MKRLSTYSREIVRTHHEYCITKVEKAWKKYLQDETKPEIKQYLDCISQFVFSEKAEDSVFIAPAEKLREFVRVIEEKFFSRQLPLSDDFESINTTLRKVFNYKAFSQIPQKGGTWYAGRLMTEALKELKYCPYCNADMVYVLNIGRKGKTRRCAFDHFYPEARYPFLGLSLYNLIPSCHRCNSLFKHDDHKELETSFHPYLDDLDTETQFILVRFPSRNDYSECRADNLTMQFRMKKTSSADPAQLDSYQKLFAIDIVYNSLYREKALQVLQLGHLLNESYREKLVQLFSKAGLSVDPVRLILGMPLKREEINMHHVAKLKLDLLEQYCGITIEK